MDGYLNFYSVSGDGRVTNWTIVKTALWYTDTLNITFSKTLHNFSEEDTKTNLRDGGRCVAFNPNDDTMFLVGTDEGLIYKCTTEYSSRFLETYPAHNTPIYNIAWNPYVPSIFLTCAAEWMIKIWDHNSTLVHTQCLKITEKVSLNFASEASYVFTLIGQKLIKNGQFWRVFENLKIAVKQRYQIGQFQSAKIGRKCQNAKIQMQHFE